MLNQYWQSKILEIYPQAKKISKDRLRILCPYHNDSSPSLDINIDSNSSFYGFVKCWSCGKTTTLKILLKDLKVGYDTTELKGTEHNDLTTILRKYLFVNIEEQKELKANEFPNSFRLFNDVCIDKRARTLALRYLKNRGIKEESINKYSIGYIGVAEQEKYDNTVVLPFSNYENTGYVYYIARKFEKYTFLRYVNLESKEGYYSRNDVFFNSIALHSYTKIILCEGVFNAICWEYILQELGIYDIGVIASNGVHLGNNQIRMLINSDLEELIIAFDYNTEKPTTKLIEQLSGYMNLSVISFETEEDANDLYIKNKDKLKEYFENKQDMEEGMQFRKILLNNLYY